MLAQNDNGKMHTEMVSLELEKQKQKCRIVYKLAKIVLLNWTSLTWLISLQLFGYRSQFLLLAKLPHNIILAKK